MDRVSRHLGLTERNQVSRKYIIRRDHLSQVKSILRSKKVSFAMQEFVRFCLTFVARNIVQELKGYRIASLNIQQDVIIGANYTRFGYQAFGISGRTLK